MKPPISYGFPTRYREICRGQALHSTPVSVLRNRLEYFGFARPLPGCATAGKCMRLLEVQWKSSRKSNKTPFCIRFLVSLVSSKQHMGFDHQTYGNCVDNPLKYIEIISGLGDHNSHEDLLEHLQENWWRAWANLLSSPFREVDHDIFICHLFLHNSSTAMSSRTRMINRL